MTLEAEWVEVHRGPEHEPWWYVTDCKVCLDFNSCLEDSAMSGELWSQRGKVLLAFAGAHHSGIFAEARAWKFLRELRAAGWPNELLREVAELAFDAGLEQGGDRIPLTVRHRVSLV